MINQTSYFDCLSNKWCKLLLVSTICGLSFGCAVDTSKYPQEVVDTQGTRWRPDERLEIAEIAWTYAVGKDKNPVTRYYKSPPAGVPLVLWMKLKGRRGTLDKLWKREGKLGIWHLWYYNDQPVEQIYLDLGNLETLGQLFLETNLSGDGTFTWRTWSIKPNLGASGGRGLWRVRVLYDDMTPVMCESLVCEYSILVK
jgi:hypothetical protein